MNELNYFHVQELASIYCLDYNQLCAAIREYVSKNKRKNKCHLSEEEYRLMMEKKGKAIGLAKTKHGYAKRGEDGKRSAIYGIWSSMKKRCSTKASGESRKNYYLRGIKVCERWEKFENFLADMGDRPEGMTLERKDNNGNYDPSNCRWATVTEQNRNRSNSVFLEFNGELKTISEWAEKYGMGRDTLKHRLYAGWSVERAITGA